MSTAIGKLNVVAVIVVIVFAAVASAYVYSTSTQNTTSVSKVVSVGLEIGAADASDVPEMYALTNELPTLGYTSNPQIFTGPQVLAAALLSGGVDIASGSPSEVANLASKGQSIVDFGVSYQVADEIMVCTNNVTSMGQLATDHVTVGMTSLTDVSYFVPAVYLDQNGYDASAVNWQVVPGAAGRGAALLSGKIPCGATDVTSTLILEQQSGNFRIVATLASLEPNFPFQMYYTTKAYYDAHCMSATNNVCLALLKANLLAYRWAQTKSNYMSFAPSVVGASINTTTLSSSYDLLKQTGIWNPNLPWNITIANTIANITATYKLVTSYAPPSTWANFTLYNLAIQAEGSYS
jgi:hypothetical protein